MIECFVQSSTLLFNFFDNMTSLYTYVLSYSIIIILCSYVDTQ